MTTTPAQDPIAEAVKIVKRLWVQAVITETDGEVLKQALAHAKQLQARENQQGLQVQVSDMFTDGDWQILLVRSKNPELHNFSLGQMLLVQSPADEQPKAGGA